MCSCKKILCADKRCSCFKKKSFCDANCSCFSCKNKGADDASDSEDYKEPKVPTSEETKYPKVPETAALEAATSLATSNKDWTFVATWNMSAVDPSSPILFPLAICSWNLCNWCSIYPKFSSETKKEEGVERKWTAEEQQQLLEDTRGCFDQLGQRVDLFVLQEFRVNKAQVELIMTWLQDRFEFAISEDSDLEHVFIWRKDRLTPHSKPVDKFERGLIPTFRPAGTMRFRDLYNDDAVVVTSVHLKSGGGAETRNDFETLFGTYRKKIEARYGTSFVAKHIVAGDVNLNPHTQRGLLPDSWVATGTADSITTVGGKWYDFFFLDKNTSKMSHFQHTLKLSRPKNSSLSKIGVSDHFPVMLQLGVW